MLVKDENKKTVGEVAREKLIHGSENCEKIEAQQLQEAFNADYIEQLNICISRKPHCDWTEPFYVIEHLTRMAWAPNVFRRKFWGRQTLPNPEADQTVWVYYPASGNCKLVWSLPDKHTIQHIVLVNPKDPNHEESTRAWCQLYYNRELWAWAKKTFRLADPDARESKEILTTQSGV